MRKSLLIATTFLLSMAGMAFGANFFWDKTLSEGDWSNPNNWCIDESLTTKATGVPGENDSVYFVAGTAARIRMTEPVTINTLYFRQGGVSVTLTGGVENGLTVRNTCSLAAPYSFNFNDAEIIVAKSFNMGTGNAIRLVDGSRLKILSSPFTIGNNSLVLVDQGSEIDVTGVITLNSGSTMTIDRGSLVSSTANIDCNIGAESMGVQVLNGSTLKSAAGINIANGSYLTARGGSLVSAGGQITLKSTSTSGRTAKMTIDDSTVSSYQNIYVVYDGNGGETILFQGERPMLLLGGALEINGTRSGGGNFDFEVPVGGYAVPPIQKASANNSFTSKSSFYFNILETSPALLAGVGSVTTELYRSYGGNLTRAQVKFDGSRNAVSESGTLEILDTTGQAATTDGAGRSIVCSFGAGEAQVGEENPNAVGVAANAWASVNRNVLTFMTLVSAMPSDASKSVKLSWYVGESAEKEELVKVHEMAVSDVGAISYAWTALEFEKTYYFMAKLETFGEDGTLIGVEESRINSAKSVDRTDYIWVGEDGGKWSDEKNWVSVYTGNCLGYPQSDSGNAVIPSGTIGTIDVGDQEIRCGSVTIRGTGVDFKIVGQEGGGLSVSSIEAGSSTDAKMTVEGITMTVRGNYSLSKGLCILLKDVQLTSTGILYMNDKGMLEVCDSTARINGLQMGGTDRANGVEGTFIIDNSQIVKSGTWYFGNSKPGGKVIFKGANPKLYEETSNDLRSIISGADFAMEFQLPEGGFDEVPIQAKSTCTRTFFHSTLDAVSIRVTVPERMLKASETLNEVLVMWPKNIEPAFFDASQNEIDGAQNEIAIQDGTNLVAVIRGTAQPTAFTVKSSTDDVGTAVPAYGTSFGNEVGETISCSMGGGTEVEIGGAHYTFGGYVVSNILADGTYEYLAQGDGASYTHTQGETAAELTWIWNVVRELGYTVQGNGSVEIESGSLAQNESVTLEAVAAEGSCFHRWSGDIGESDPYSPTITLERDQVRNVVAHFGKYLYVAEGGSDAEENEGRSLATAFATIQTAIDRAEEGDVIRVAPGVYYHRDKVAKAYVAKIEKNIVLESVEGAEDTILDASQGAGSMLGVSIGSGCSRARVSGFTIRNGRSADYGVIPGLEASSGIVSNCIIKAAAISRSVVVALSGTAVLQDSVVDGTGLANINPDGINGLCSLNGNAMLERCVVKDITIGGRCYGVHLNENATIRGCVISGILTGNLSSSASFLDGEVVGFGLGGAVYMKGGVIENCTIYNNRTRGNGGGIYVVQMPNVPVRYVCRNTIIYGNTADNGAGNDIWGHPMWDNGRKIFENCCSSNLAGTEDRGNMAVNPNFSDVENGDVTLEATSLVVNRGEEQGWMVGAKDIAGNPRIFGSRPDMGAYEQCDEIEGILCLIVASDETKRAPATFEAESFLVGNDEGAVCTWDFGDGTASEVGAIVSHTYDHFGEYTATLHVVNSEGEEATATHRFMVSPARTYVSRNGLGEYPFDTWEKATDNLQAAIDVGPYEVLVTNGTYYTQGESIVLASDVHVKSVEGAEKTVIDTTDSENPNTMPLGLDKRHFSISHEGAIVEGFTFVRGNSANYGFPASVQSTAGLIKDCIFRGVHRLGRSNLAFLGGTARMIGCRFFLEKVSIWNHDSDNGVIEVSGNAVIERCEMSGMVFNSDSTDRYAVVMLSQNAAIRSSLIARNNRHTKGNLPLVSETVRGCAIKIIGGAPMVDNCTVVSNSVSGHGAGLYIRSCDGAKIRNNIFTGNVALVSDDDLYYGNDLSKIQNYVIENNLIQKSVTPVLSTTGTHTFDPGLKDIQSNDYTLKRSSQSINKGIFLEWMDEDSEDLEGNVRIFGSFPDLGCYENHLPAPLFMLLR